jgi:hypothetical protein
VFSLNANSLPSLNNLYVGSGYGGAGYGGALGNGTGDGGAGGFVNLSISGEISTADSVTITCGNGGNAEAMAEAMAGAMAVI